MNRRDFLAAPAVLTLGSRSVWASDRIQVGMLKPNIVTAIYWIAMKTGAFERNGLDIAENPFPSGQTAAGIEQLIRVASTFTSARAARSRMPIHGISRPANSRRSR